MLAVGTQVDRYVVEGVLGTGGMAVVYRARHQALRTVHALKVLTITAPHVRERLLVEGRIQAELRHPNLVGVTDVVDVAGAPALVMDYVEGPTLEAWLHANGPAPLDVAEAIFAGVVAGVAAAHARGLVHRDLKPGNVLLDLSRARPVARVADFGIAKVLADDDGPMSRTRTGVMMGSPPYMPPEQFESARDVDARADVFALGCILYELLAGRPAFDHPNPFQAWTAIKAGEWTRMETLRGDVPAAWRAAVEGCLVPDRAARIPDCARLAAVFEGRAPFAAASVVSPPSATPPSATPPSATAPTPPPETPPGPQAPPPVRRTVAEDTGPQSTSPPRSPGPTAPLSVPPAAPPPDADAAFWASVARSLEAGTRSPKRTAEFLNRVPAAKARAPNGRHWTGRDVEVWHRSTRGDVPAPTERAPTAPELPAPTAPALPRPKPAFVVDTSNEANFWASVERALPDTARTPREVAQFLNQAPLAKARAPNGKHWTGPDVEAQWSGMPARLRPPGTNLASADGRIGLLLFIGFVVAWIFKQLAAAG